jgi:hypothetical protein
LAISTKATRAAQIAEGKCDDPGWNRYVFSEPRIDEFLTLLGILY